MQIHSIQKNNTTFGYNPLVNSKIMYELSHAKKNKAYSDYILNLCKITNQTELKLRNAEKRGMPELTNKLAKIFLPIKIVLTDLIDTYYPDYNYKNIELETYADELYARNLENDQNHWLTSLVAFMGDDVNDYETDEIQNENNINEDGTSTPYLQGAILISANYLNKSADEDEVEETDEDITPKEGKNRLEESIELGKSKVIEYIPDEKAKKGFESLGGMKELKAELQDKVIDFLKDPEQAQLDAKEYGTKLPKGLLFYGPPGCGKTTIVKHMAVEAGVPLFLLETGSLKSSYYHETSKNIDAAFDYAASVATPQKPVLLMIDDGESFFLNRDGNSRQFEAEEMTSFLNKIQEAPTKNVMVALTTNKYDIMDSAIRSRFNTQIYVGLPDKEARISILELLLNRNIKSAELAKDKNAVTALAEKLEGYPIRAIEDIVLDACNIPKREANEARKKGIILRRNVTMADFDKILSKPETQNKKIKEELYKTKSTRSAIGFSQFNKK